MQTYLSPAVFASQMKIFVTVQVNLRIYCADCKKVYYRKKNWAIEHAELAQFCNKLACGLNCY